MHVHVQQLVLPAHQGTTVSEIKITLHVRSQQQVFCLSLHLNHDAKFLSLMDKQGAKFHIRVYDTTQTPQTNTKLACVLWIITAQCNGPGALIHLYRHLQS